MTATSRRHPFGCSSLIFMLCVSLVAGSRHDGVPTVGGYRRHAWLRDALRQPSPASAIGQSVFPSSAISGADDENETDDDGNSPASMPYANVVLDPLRWPVAADEDRQTEVQDTAAAVDDADDDDSFVTKRRQVALGGADHAHRASSRDRPMTSSGAGTRRLKLDGLGGWKGGRSASTEKALDEARRLLERIMHADRLSSSVSKRQPAPGFHAIRGKR